MSSPNREQTAYATDSATTSRTPRGWLVMASCVTAWARMAPNRRGCGDAGQLGQHRPRVRGVVSIEIPSIAEPAVWAILRHSRGNQPCQAPVPRTTGSPRNTQRRRSQGIPAVVPTSRTMSEMQWQLISRGLGQDD
jgi:hypothetical protein